MKKIIWFTLFLVVLVPRVLAFETVVNSSSISSSSISSSSISTSVANNACAIVSTKVLTLNHDEYRLIMTNVGKKARRTDAQVAMKPGKHRLLLNVVRRSTPMASNLNDIEYSGFRQLSDPISFDIEVEANKLYRLVAQVEDKAVTPSKRRYSVKVVNEIDKLCDDPKPLERTLNVLSRVNVALPNNLQYRLSLLMKDVRDHYRKAGVSEQTIQLFGNGGIIDVLGIVIDYQAPAKQGLKVLAVTPASAAANIGLKPGDVIVKVNELSFKRSGMNHQQMGQAFKLMFNHLNADNPATIEINRGSDNIELNAHYEQVSIPEYQIQLQIE